MHTKDSLCSFSIPMSPTSPVWKNSHPSVSGFLHLFISCQITSFSHSLIPLFHTHGGFLLNFPLHSALHTSLPSQVMLFPSHYPPSPIPCSYQLLQLNFFLLLYSLSHKAQLCPCCLHNTIPGNIFPSFCPLAGLFHFKGGSVVCLGLLLFFEVLKERERKAETASHQCSSPSKQLTVEPGEDTLPLLCFLACLDVQLSKQPISARDDTLL